MVKIPRKAKILLIKLRSIGDVVYNTAVYTPLKECLSQQFLKLDFNLYTIPGDYNRSTVL